VQSTHGTAHEGTQKSTLNQAIMRKEMFSKTRKKTHNDNKTKMLNKGGDKSQKDERTITNV